MASYLLAIEQGADFIEPDLVSTKDGVLVARHENELSATTDVATHGWLADRRTTKVIDGRELTGWFTEDLTIDELRSLRARSSSPRERPGAARYDGQLAVPTFEEILDLAHHEGRRRGRAVGVYPEIKHPSYFASIGLGLEEPLVRALQRRGLDRHDAPVLVQCFEPGSLYDLDAVLDVPLVQLIDVHGPAFHLLSGRGGLEDIAGYADALGVAAALVLPHGPAGPASDLVERAHLEALDVHVWGAPPAALPALLDAEVDGVFTDHPDLGVRARDDWAAAPAAPLSGARVPVSAD